METRDAMRRRARFALEVLEERNAPSTVFITVSGNVTNPSPPGTYVYPGATQGLATAMSTGTTFASSSASVAVLPS